MAENVKNYGVAGTRVRILSSLPKITRNFKKYNFDVSAYQWMTIQNSPYIHPLLTEAVIDPMGTFAACFPSKRKFTNFPNYLDGFTPSSSGSSGQSSVASSVTWKPIQTTDGIVSDLVTNTDNPYDTYTLLMPQNYVNQVNTINSEYLGPIWYPDQVKAIKNPDDKNSIKQFFQFAQGLGAANQEGSNQDEETSDTELIPMLPTVFQAAKRSGLWWGLESSVFLTENMPFWVTLTAAQSPTTVKHETFFVVSIGSNTSSGGGSSENRFDLYLSLDRKPRLIDYYGSGATDNVQKEWDMDTSILRDQERIEIGCMSIAGRLVFSVNDEILVYNRISHESGDAGGKLKECKIPAGSIRLYGSNCQVGVHVCPMTFAPLSIFALNLPTIMTESGGQASSIDTTWKGQKNDGTYGGSVAELPKPPSTSESLFGVDCQSFSGDGGTCTPSGFGFHKKGKIWFSKASQSTFSGLPNSDFYTITMVPSTTNYENDGCPYFFRLKGGTQSTPGSSGAGGTDVSDLVIAVDETASAPDYFHVKKSATVTLYNENDDADVSGTIRAYQSGIEISWGWNGNFTKTFTGVVTNVNTSEVAGKEVLTLQCEDYMYILKNVPIVNSPFYDGMIAAYALKDLAERAGITNVIIDWDSINDYFLPSGYAFSKPAMRFPSSNKLFDCMIDMLKRFEAYMYFDENGNLHLAKLQGGLFSASATSSADFTSDGTSANGNIILDERRIDYNFDSTVNNISVFTLERDTRNPVIYGYSAGQGGTTDHLLFGKSLLYDQPALGEIEVARSYAHELAERVFYPIRKTSFKTVGNTSTIQALSFITVDGIMFRLMSLKRSFNADDNNFVNDYECEWLGGE